MDKQKIRRIFHQYRERIAQLQEKNDELENQINEQAYYHDGEMSRANKRAEACRIERLDQERQAESDRWYRENELRRAVGDLERARSYGDEWGMARATEKLKKLG